MLNKFLKNNIVVIKCAMATFCMLLMSAASLVAQKIEPLSAALTALQPVNVFPANPKVGYVFNDKN